MKWLAIYVGFFEKLGVQPTVRGGAGGFGPCVSAPLCTSSYVGNKWRQSVLQRLAPLYKTKLESFYEDNHTFTALIEDFQLSITQKIHHVKHLFSIVVFDNMSSRFTFSASSYGYECQTQFIFTSLFIKEVCGPWFADGCCLSEF